MGTSYGDFPASTTCKYAASQARIWGGHIAFGQEFNDIICNAKDLDVQNHSADPIMAQYSKRMLEQELSANAKMSERVRRLIVLLLPRGRCRVEVVALHLGIDRRTISNHLLAEGTNFKALVNQIRTDLLTHYRKSGAKILSELTPLLGFSEPSAFQDGTKIYPVQMQVK